jgi:hypothetical protein
MIKYLLTAVMAISAISAHANIGDTLPRAIERYGQPIANKQGLAVWLQEGWIIMGLFDSKGYCNLVGYVKRGTMTKEDCQLIDNDNHIDMEQLTWMETPPNALPANFRSASLYVAAVKRH